MGLFSSFTRVFPLSTTIKQFKIEMDWSSMKTATQAAQRYTETDESDPAGNIHFQVKIH